MKPESRLVLADIELSGADFSRRKLVQLSVTSSRLTRCSFRGMVVEDACFGAGRSDSIYVDCSFDDSRIRAPAPGRARFIRCSFRNVDIRDFIGRTIELVDCVFSGSMKKGIFYGAVPSGVEGLDRVRNEFSGNDFSDMELVDVAFRGGITLEEQVLPTGSQYLFVRDAVRSLRLLRQHLLAESDLELRRKAFAMLSALEHTVNGGQEQLLINRHSWPKGIRTAVDVLFNKLREYENQE